jgi:hypothetical protein
MYVAPLSVLVQPLTILKVEYTQFMPQLSPLSLHRLNAQRSAVHQVGSEISTAPVLPGVARLEILGLDWSVHNASGRGTLFRLLFFCSTNY